MNFTSVLFRLANMSKDSIVCVEISRVEASAIVEQKHWLINPDCTFSFENCAQREFLEAKDVENCPKFPDVWSELRPYFENQMLVTQNTGHVIKMLTATLERYALPLPNFTFFDSKDVAKKVFGGFISYDPYLFGTEIGIPYQYGFGNFAEFVSKMMLKAFSAIGASSFEELEQKYSVISGKVIDGKYTPYHDHIPYKTKVSIKDIDTNYNADPSHPLFGKTIVFTGTLPIKRPDARQLAATYGAIPPDSGVTEDTNILVIGQFDARKLTANNKSRKMIDAEKKLKNGQNIEVIGWQEFMELVS